ncbi:hypothetical protein [Paenibacillus xylaniclasticus]|uniref:hypothetical protein n=1 Tax=Paenibacillus xylaniclasticus TaxID=588083 RepID=UPI000FDC4945|nr:MULTISPECIES: hypothetical protein [Paenibacillus]GFN33875.1 hypothetical protein PCURB6_41350 [Paenibacillus curdlanolyticus]
MVSQRNKASRLTISSHARIAATVVLATVLSGCSLFHDKSDQEVRITGNDPLNSNQMIKSNQGPANHQSEHPEASPILNSAADESKETTNASNTTSSKPKTQESKWDKSKPTLAGVALGTSKDSVKKKNGDPLDTFVQKNKDDSIEIFEYDGYSIGFGSAAQGAIFIEVYDKKLDPGLAGLHVGDKEDQAVKALGKPASQTPYLLSYETKSGLLKLDLDPDSHEIMTMKLFSQS